MVISKKGHRVIRHIRVVIWLSVLAVLLSACSLDEDPDSSGAASPGNVLRIDVDYDFGPFNPHRVDASGSTYVFPYYYTLVLYNTRHPLFENPNVRRALTHAIDRESMVSEMLGAMAEVVARAHGKPLSLA